MSETMNIWEHLFLTGEFPARAVLLSGLTLEQVTLRPDGASHSIYEELWHAEAYQRYIVERGPATGDHFPKAAPEHEQQWHDLVQQFLEGAQAAVAWAQAPDPTRGGGGAWSDDGRRAEQRGGAQCVSPRQDRRVAAEDRCVAAEGGDG